MKSASILVAIAFLMTVAVAGVSAAEPTPDGPPKKQEWTPGSLAVLVAEIANSTKLSAEDKERDVADLVRKATIERTADIEDPAQVLALALELATAAATAAPQFAQTIVNTIATIPSLASIEGAMTSVRSALASAASESAGASRESGSGPATPRPASPASNSPSVIGSPSR
jgi:hypothetical protein